MLVQSLGINDGTHVGRAFQKTDPPDHDNKYLQNTDDAPTIDQDLEKATLRVSLSYSIGTVAFKLVEGNFSQFGLTIGCGRPDGRFGFPFANQAMPGPAYWVPTLSNDLRQRHLSDCL